MRSYEKLIDERGQIYKMDVREEKQNLRQRREEDDIQMEKQRGRNNLHNFTNICVGRGLKALFDNSGVVFPIPNPEQSHKHC